MILFCQVSLSRALSRTNIANVHEPLLKHLTNHPQIITLVLQKKLVIRALKTLLLITLNFNLYYIAYKTIKRMIIQVQTVKTEGNVCVGQIWSLSNHYLSYARIIFPAGFARHGVLNKNPTVWLDG